MKSPNIPKGLHAHYFEDESGWTVCVLLEFIEGKPVARSTDFARYNPADYSDPQFPFDTNTGRAIALKRAIRTYHKGWW